jgi:hypothetical protein
MDFFDTKKTEIIHSAVMLLVVTLFVVLSFCMPEDIRIISNMSKNADGKTGFFFTDEYMSGGGDIIAFVAGGILFLPAFIELAVTLLRMLY